jgi:glycosyltransferase involved in cell wall biosynthesis
MSKTDVFFSIVIPTYNRATFIKKTIESLISQQYSTFEIIVVDDGSTDNTDEIVRSIRDSRIKYFKKENAERGAARNFGARLAKGDYINFFDSDDLAYDNHLSEAKLGVHRLNSPEVLHLGYDIKGPDDSLILKEKTFPPTINELLINGNHLSCNGVFIRKDIALHLPFSENRELSASEDYVLWLKLASRHPFHCINTITTTVVNHEMRSVMQVNKEKLIKRLDLLQKEVLADSSFTKAYSKKLNIFKAYLQLYVALHLAMANNPAKENLSYLVKAIRIRPTIVFSYRFLAALKNVIL